METRQLESRIATLRGQVRRLLALHGMSWVAGLVIPLIILAGLIDWLFHLDVTARLLFLLALAGLTAWLGYRFVLVPLFVRFADLDIALRIEERWPGLNDRLSSTIQFLNVADDDDRFGSRVLREATVRQTLEHTHAIDFREAVESRPAWRALGVATLSMLAALGVIAAEPTLARTAMRRLFLPFGSDAWPQQTHLALLAQETPRKVAKGDPFTLAVTVAKGERVPTGAKAVYRFDDGETLAEPLRVFEGGIFRGRVEAVERSFKFSVSAGDDSTSIRDIPVAVVPPPVIKEMTVRLVAPAYTKIEPQTLAPGKTQIRAVQGTRVEVEALANKPIEVARLRLGEKSTSDGVTLDTKRTRLKTAFTLQESNPFWFELRDTEGFRNREVTRYDLRAVKDEAPRVVIDEPTNDRDVPAQATVPVVFTVDDDFGVHSARLIYKVASGGSEPTQEVVLPLWDASDSAVPVKHHQVKFDWDLAPLKLSPGSIITFHADARDFDTINGPNLGKSRELRLRIVSDEDIARQLDDSRRAIREDIEGILAMEKQAKTPVDEALRSISRTGEVPKAARENLKNAEMIQRQVGSRVTNKADGLDQKIGRFLDDLKNFKVNNPDAQKQMEGMRDSVGRIRDNNLEPAEQGLTRASKTLEQPGSGDQNKAADSGKPEQTGKASDTPKKSDSQRADADSQARSDKSAAKTATDAAGRRSQDGQTKSGGQPKADSNKNAASASKEQQGNPDEKASPAENASPDKNQPARSKPTELARSSLSEAQTNQKQIADELQKMLEGLSEFETVRGVVKDAQNLVKEHEQAMKQATEAAGKPDLMGKTPDQLTPQQKDELETLGNRQSNVAKGLQSLKEKMDQMAGKLNDSDPLAAAGMREASEQVSKKGTAAKIGEAADQLQKNQMGAARSSQEQARNDLKNLLDAIQNRRERELSRLVKELKNAEADLKKLRDRQTENLRKSREAGKLADPKQRANELKKLAKEQAEIQKELDRQLKRLAKLNADAAAQAAARAGGKMGKAQKDLDNDQGEKADQEQDDALADLEEAEDQTRQARKDAEEQLAMEQLSKMGDQLKSLAERQEKVVNDTAGYEKLRAEKQGKLSIPQRNGIRQLGGVEDALKDETTELLEKLEGAPVFSLTLKRATEGMTTAAERLQALKTDDPTQRAARAAAARFKQLLDSLKPDKPKNGGQQQGGGGGGGGGGGNGDGIPPAAQIKMLKALQEEINERTEFFDELQRRKKELTPDQTAELDRLHEDQGTLADLVRDLTKPKKNDAEE